MLLPFVSIASYNHSSAVSCAQAAPVYPQSLTVAPRCFSPNEAKRSPKRPLTFPESILAGGIAGIVEISIMYPLDVVKTHAQLNSGQNQNMFAHLKELVAQRGFGIYRGIIPPMMAEAPKRAIKFAANSKYQTIFNFPAHPQFGAICAGVCAGLTEAFVVVPFELVKIRMQSLENLSKYRSSMHCLQCVIKEEGLLALYAGLEATLWRHASWNGGYFGVIFGLRQYLPTASSEGEKQWWNFVAGSIAGAFGTMLNTPFDVVKSRIQNQGKIANPKYGWTLPSVRIVAREEGFRALYKGFAPKVMRLGPGGGILLVAYESVSNLIRELRP